MKLDSFERLLVEQLRDLYSAERQLNQVFPKLIDGATCERLQAALRQHADETHEHQQRLEAMLGQLQESPGRKRCYGMEGLIAESQEILKDKGYSAVKDAAIIAAVQRMEHFEIACYGTARSFAEMLGRPEIAQALQSTLEEERDVNDILTELAMAEVNVEARAVSAAG